jgi:hypothetical protein
MKKLYGKIIDISIYNYEIPVFYGDIELMHEWAKRKYKNYPIIENSYGAFCYRENPEKFITPDFIYIGKTRNNYNYISHESLHCALFILANSNVYINENEPVGHEALTYLLGYIVGEIQNAKWYEYDFKNKKWKK